MKIDKEKKLQPSLPLGPTGKLQDGILATIPFVCEHLISFDAENSNIWT